MQAKAKITDGEHPQFEAVLAALEIDHIAGGRVNGTENIVKILDRLKNCDKQDAVFRKAIDAVIKDGGGLEIQDIINALAEILVVPKEISNSLLWHTRDFCCALGMEITKTKSASR